MLPEYAARFESYDEEDKQRRIQKARTNFKLDGVVDYSGLSDEQKEEIYKQKLPDTHLNVKLIAFDLDDTLLNEQLTISPRTVAAIQKAAEKGIYIVLCSGRTENAILPYVRLLEIEGKQTGRYLIGINGASCLDLHKRQPIHTQKLGSGILKIVHQEASKRDLGCHVCDADTIYADRDTDWTRKEAGMCNLNFKVVEDFDAFLESGHPKILVPAPEDKIAEFLPELKSMLNINKDSLGAFSILENTHTLDADYIYRDFKELIVELGYFEKEELKYYNSPFLKFEVLKYSII